MRGHGRLLVKQNKYYYLNDFFYSQLANSLVFLLYLLSGKPDWQRRIRSELPSCSILSAEDIAAATSVRAAVNEAFRLLPIAPFLARLLDAPMNVGGHKLPPGVNNLCYLCILPTVAKDRIRLLGPGIGQKTLLYCIWLCLSNCYYCIYHHAQGCHFTLLLLYKKLTLYVYDWH